MAVIVTFGELLAEFVAEEVGKGFLDPSTVGADAILTQGLILTGPYAGSEIPRKTIVC
ncbi:hypothetical protein D3C87_2001600 [compost metagenome]